MATRYATCPTCQAQSSISVCDNCKTDIPAGEVPAMSGRVWDPEIGGFASVDLCTTCAGQNVNLLALVTTPAPEQPTEPGNTGEPQTPSEPVQPIPDPTPGEPTTSDAGATTDA